jgi:hypothetical protein
MLTTSRPYLWPIVDQETLGVVCFASTVTVAQAVAQGLINSAAMTVWYPQGRSPSPAVGYNTTQDQHWTLVFNQAQGSGSPSFVTSDCNVAQPRVDAVSTRPLDFVAMPPEQITTQWLALRALASARAAAMDLLERRCEKYLARTHNFIGDSQFLAYVGPQLALCQPDRDYYAPLILDWAQINGVAPSAAYDELNMQWHSAGIATVNIHALWHKYLRLINQQTDRKAMEQLVKVQFEGEIRYGKRP